MGETAMKKRRALTSSARQCSARSVIGKLQLSSSMRGCKNACDFVDVEPQTSCDAFPVCRISLEKVLNLQFLNALRNRLHASQDIPNQSVLFVGRHQAEQVSRL